MCIRDPINKTCRKNGKDLSNGAPNIKLWNHTKKTHFPVFAKNFRRPCMKLKNFFCQFPNPWTLRVSGMGGYTSKCEKKSKSLHPSTHPTNTGSGQLGGGGGGAKWIFFTDSVSGPFWVSFVKKIWSKFEEIKKFATRPPVSTKGSFSSAPKKGTSGCRKKFFLLDPHSRGLLKQHIQKSDKNSKKKLLGLRG
jgi:hypothetical protein